MIVVCAGRKSATRRPYESKSWEEWLYPNTKLCIVGVQGHESYCCLCSFMASIVAPTCTLCGFMGIRNVAWDISEGHAHCPNCTGREPDEQKDFCDEELALSFQLRKRAGDNCCKYCGVPLSDGCIYDHITKTEPDRHNCQCEKEKFFCCPECFKIGCHRCGCPHPPKKTFSCDTTCPSCGLPNAYLTFDECK